jgi:oligopeptide transport system substrate-binding protein
MKAHYFSTFCRCIYLSSTYISNNLDNANKYYSKTSAHLFLNAFALLSLFGLIFVGCQFSQEDHPSKESLHTIKISSKEDPQSLDPRLIRDLPSVTHIHMLYEGLMRYNGYGKPTLALAEKVDISEDNKTYTFYLRPSTWSNGDPLTAYDFEYTWKSVLDPKTPAPNANQLYVIKGAKEAKEGKGQIESVGIRASSPKILIVELESPTPYFLELAATHFYLPVSKKWIDEGSQSEKLISNGPFHLLSFKHHNEITAMKNPLYWDANSVKINKILYQILDENTGLQLFETGQLDWHGSPTSTLPADSIHTLKAQGLLQIKPGAGTHWIRFNTDANPFQNTKLRRAFALAIDRKGLVEHVLQGNQIPAMAVVPPSLKLSTHYFDDHDVPAAWNLFQEALEELKVSIDDFPVIALCYIQSDRSSRIAQALQQQWQKAFGIEVKLEICDNKSYFQRLTSHEYQMSLGSWFADILDPMYFLSLFEYRSNSTNNTQWENAKYAELLKKSSEENSEHKRMNLLHQAEGILMMDMPVAPLFFSNFNYLKQPQLKGVYFSELGFLDFKEAYFDYVQD